MDMKRAFGMIAGLAAGMRFQGIAEIPVEISARHGAFHLVYDLEKTAALSQEQHFFIDCLGPVLIANEEDGWKRGKGSLSRLTFHRDLAVDLDISFLESGREVRERLDLQDIRALALDTANASIAGAAISRALFDHPFSGNGRGYILDAAEHAVRTLHAEAGGAGGIEIEARHLDRIARVMIEVPGIGTGGYEPDVLSGSIADHLRMALALTTDPEPAMGPVP